MARALLRDIDRRRLKAREHLLDAALAVVRRRAAGGTLRLLERVRARLEVL